MTGQPRIALDNLTSDALDALYDRLDLLENGARERSALLEEARDALEAAGINEAHGGESWPRLGPAIEELAAERDRLAADNVRLTAGQCIDQLAVCNAHHLPPVAGCPYPRCRAARATGRAATA
ncbi:hypothetical protein AMK23_26200 [Streptomyces sp. CB02130]|uniref:hypothetical protein n=1 Tax=Streptomyces sp. CB02130 TaxID=1703934 RepID=UPI00093A6CFB|nr:hypothetical protein [Streptomyces sp. CB02130]OKJ24330.1 hypothetical protein AMK23_26200 [Streptomyces sp. CB02130]